VGSTRTIEQRMGDAFDNYFVLSEILTTDLKRLLDGDVDDGPSRRNLVRSGAALFEGYAHCLREMCVLGLECTGTPQLSRKEVKILRHADLSMQLIESVLRCVQHTPSTDSSPRLRLMVQNGFTYSAF
jgi:hypothetical protein